MMQDYFKAVQRRVLASAQRKELDEELKRARRQFNREFQVRADIVPSDWGDYPYGRKR